MSSTAVRLGRRGNPFAPLAPAATTLATALLYAVALSACGGGSGGGGEAGPGGGAGGGGGSGGSGGGPTVLQSIDITPANASVQVGKTLQLVATGHYSNGTTSQVYPILWSSGTPSVATVDVSGLVSAIAIGTSTITVTSNAVAASATLNVTAGPAAVSYLHSFGPGDGAQPNGPLLQASDGNFYGTTRAGGASTCQGQPNFCGALFKITPAGVETVLYSFGASASDGNDPTAPLLQISDGNFYGTTALGGTNGDGTVFKITPAGVETVLYSFGASASDGFEPLAPLVQASDGNFYGTTSQGGAYGGGTVFKITPEGTETVLYSFGASPSNGSPPQGFIPQGPLIQASDGNLYGTTAEGGAHSNCGYGYGCGTVFTITLNGAQSVLYSFAGNSSSDGYYPTPFLIQGSDGNFYGTTGSGGAFGGDLNGTVFRIAPAAGTETVLYSFGPGDTNPSDPLAGVIQGSDGAFYGVTSYSGGINSGAGTVFKLVTTH